MNIVSADILECKKNNPYFLTTVIICGETWIFQYDPEITLQSIHWKSPDSLKIEIQGNAVF